MNLNMVAPGPNPYCIIPMDHPARGYVTAEHTDIRRTFALAGWPDNKPKKEENEDEQDRMA